MRVTRIRELNQQSAQINEGSELQGLRAKFRDAKPAEEKRDALKQLSVARILRVLEFFINLRRRGEKFRFHPDEISQLRSVAQGRAVLSRHRSKPNSESANNPERAEQRRTSDPGCRRDHHADDRRDDGRDDAFERQGARDQISGASADRAAGDDGDHVDRDERIFPHGVAICRFAYRHLSKWAAAQYKQHRVSFV